MKDFIRWPGWKFLLLGSLVLILLLVGRFLTRRFRVYQQLIPPGVTVAGVDVGGLLPAEAQARLQEEVVAPLMQPLLLHYGETPLHLEPEAVGFRVDVSGMVAEAYAAGQETSWEDFWRWLRDQPPRFQAQVPLRTAYDPAALRAFLQEVAAIHDRSPQPPRIVTNSLVFVAGQPGWALDVEASAQRIAAVLPDPARPPVDLVIQPLPAPVPDATALTEMLETVAPQIDIPPQPRRVFTVTLTDDDRWPPIYIPPGRVRVAYDFDPGRLGRRLEITPSVQLIQAALVTATEGTENTEVGSPLTVPLVITPLVPAPFTLADLEPYLITITQVFSGRTGFYVEDLASGEVISRDEYVAISGMSLMKVGILLAAHREYGLHPPPEIDTNMEYMITESLNTAANLVLVYLGDEDATEGIKKVNEVFRALGLRRTFMRQPYRIPGAPNWPPVPRPELPTTGLPADQVAVNTKPDPMMQTCLADMAALFRAIYQGCQGEGPLPEVDPIYTPELCCAMLERLTHNPVRTMVGSGFSPDVPLAHKHGFTGSDTICDVGIVLPPNGHDYLFGFFVYEDTDWINFDRVFPMFTELSATVYNFFTMGEPAPARPKASG